MTVDAPYVACKETLNTYNLLASKVRIKLQTDLGKPIKDEWVILVGSADKPGRAKTNGEGIVEFPHLAAPPHTRCFIVLPDVLEGWESGDSATQMIVYPYAPNPCGPTTAKLQPLSDPLTNVHAKAAGRKMENKDQIAIAAGHSDAAASYREKDRVKHCVFTRQDNTDDDAKPETLIINRLTEMEKFLYLRDTFESNEACYTIPDPAKYTGEHKLGFHTPGRRWNWAEGAVCNQFGNFFCSYWFNFNSAFNVYMVQLDWVRLMEGYSSSLTSAQNVDGNPIKVRGFSDFSTLAAFPDDVLKVALKHAVKHDIVRHPEYMRIRHKKKDPVDDWSTDGPRFVSQAFMNNLGGWNIYSISDANIDHHGGVLIKSTFPDDPTAPTGSDTPAAVLRKIAADGYYPKYFTYGDDRYAYPPPVGKEPEEPKAPAEPVTKQAKALYDKPMAKYKRNKTAYDGRKAFFEKVQKHYRELAGAELPPASSGYSQKPITFRPYDDPVTNLNLHLRIWALKPLRRGGYAPGSADGEYKPEASFGNPADVVPHVAHSLPRFIRWQGKAGAGIKTLNDFMARTA